VLNYKKWFFNSIEFNRSGFYSDWLYCFTKDIGQIEKLSFLQFANCQFGFPKLFYRSFSVTIAKTTLNIVMIQKRTAILLS